jgi:hypothetical protein
MEQEKVLENPINFLVEISAMAKTTIFGVISIASFFTPFAFGHPQWLVGTVVNAGLFLSAMFLPKKYFLPIVIFPGLGVLARGLVFGPFTYFLVYFLPFIWLGNLVLILIFKYLFSKFKFIGSAVFASVAKFLFLFLIAGLYFKFHFVPALFVQTMGLNQLATALAGGLIASLFFYGHRKFFIRS